MNDYVAAYHDAVLLVGQVMRQIIRNNQSHSQEMDFVSVNHFRNISFNGRGMDQDSRRVLGSGRCPGCSLAEAPYAYVALV